MSSARTHLPGRKSSEVDVCPLLLNGFTVGTPHTLRIVKGVLGLTFRAVCSQVELGHEVGKGEAGQIDVWVGSPETFVEVDGPLAGNVIGNFDVTDLTTLEVLGDDIVGVDVATMGLAPVNIIRKISYRSPRCKSPTAVGRTKQWRAQTALTTPLAM